MTYEQFAATMWHEGNCHGSELLPYAEITYHRGKYEVYCPLTDTEAEAPKPVSYLNDYDAAQRDLYERAVKNSLL